MRWLWSLSFHIPGGLCVSVLSCSPVRRWRPVRNWPLPCHGASSWTRRGAAETRCSAPAATAHRPPPRAVPRTPSPPKVRGAQLAVRLSGRLQVRRQRAGGCSAQRNSWLPMGFGIALSSEGALGAVICS